MPRLLAGLRAATKTRVSEVERGKGRSGIYALFEGRSCVYVGRTRAHARRLRDHSDPASGENKAALAFLLTREALGLPTKYKAGDETRKGLMRQPRVRRMFDRQKKRIAAMHFAFVEVEDGPLQAMFEVYAAIALRASHSKFLNH
jgi:hypothetical protein